MTSNQGGYLARPSPSGLADVIEIVLDKGIVLDAYARVSLVGIELMTLDARIVIASVDTYLRFAEATNRLDLSDKGGRPLADLAAEGAGAAVEKVAGGVVERKVGRTLDKVGDKVGEPVEKVVRTGGRKVLDKAGDVVRKASD
jgi:hypothetical protein